MSDSIKIDAEMRESIAAIMQNSRTTITFSSSIPLKLWLQRHARATGKSVSEICSGAIEAFAQGKQKQDAK